MKHLKTYKIFESILSEKLYHGNRKGDFPPQIKRFAGAIFLTTNIDFAKNLEEQLSGKTRSPSSILLATTHLAHISIKPNPDDPNLLYRIPSQPSMDGNSVDSDVELSQFTKNSVFTEAALTFLGGTIRSRMSAITGQPS